MPQAASAHDTFWDFVSLMPESTHMLMWVMSDRAIPRSFRTMQGFGVHTFRLVNDAGDSVFCKFHWQPHAGTHSLVWDEAVKISGADPDFHRRDLWEAIEAGAYPQWDLQVQVFTEEDADRFSFDILDATKIVPEELVPLQTVGRLVLNRNPDNFFAETEQVAFCTANVVPGIDFSNDPLLAGRIHSYHDTQLSRLGGPNFHEIPINAPVVQVHNNQRDGIHRQAIHRGAVAYEPNSLAGGCPFQAGAAHGFMTVPARLRAREEAAKVRAKPELFADHYTQARLFYESQSAPEQAHIADAFAFELSKVTVPAVRERMVASLRNASDDAGAQGGRQDRHRADAAAAAARDGAAAQARGHALAGVVAVVPPRQRLDGGPQGGAVRRTEGRLEHLLRRVARSPGQTRAPWCVAWRRALARCAPPTARPSMPTRRSPTSRVSCSMRWCCPTAARAQPTTRAHSTRCATSTAIASRSTPSARVPNCWRAPASPATPPTRA